MLDSISINKEDDSLLISCKISPMSLKNKSDFFNNLSVSFDGRTFIEVETGVVETDLRVISDLGAS